MNKKQDLFNKIKDEAQNIKAVEHEPIDLDAVESSYKKALNYSIRILARRDYSIHKMKQKLRERKFEMSDIEQVIEKLLEYNYLREEEYTRMRIKQLIFKGYANRHILQKLQQECLSSNDAVVDEVRQANDKSSESELTYLIEKKLRHKEIPTEFNAKMKLKQKITSFCVSKGYGFSEINATLSNYI